MSSLRFHNRQGWPHALAINIDLEEKLSTFSDLNAATYNAFEDYHMVLM